MSGQVVLNLVRMAALKLFTALTLAWDEGLLFFM
jgi:hypothetical protein